MHSFQPPNDNDIVFYPSGGHFNKVRRDGFLRELLHAHFQGWIATRNKKDYILNVILPKVGTSYFVDKNGAVSILDKDTAAEKMRYQLDYTKKHQARKRETKTDATIPFHLADSHPIQLCQQSSGPAMIVPQNGPHKKKIKTVADTIPIPNQGLGDLSHQTLLDPMIPFEVAATTPTTGATASAVVASGEIVDALLTMKNSLDRLLICNEKIYVRLFQDLNKISDKLEESSRPKQSERTSHSAAGFYS